MTAPRRPAWAEPHHPRLELTGWRDLCAAHGWCRERATLAPPPALVPRHDARCPCVDCLGRVR